MQKGSHLVPSSHSLLIFSFWITFRRSCKSSVSYLVPVSNYWTWTKTTLQKNQFFWSNPHKISVMELFDNCFLVVSWIETVTSESLFKNQELLLDVAQDIPYCVIVSLAIWVISFIYFFDFGYFAIFSSEKQIYSFILNFITHGSYFA